MSEKKDGGPAFPGGQEYPNDKYNGMTLRDYFASHSPFGINQALDIVNGVGIRNVGAKVDEVAKKLAELNYAYADAMLAEREK